MPAQSSPIDICTPSQRYGSNSPRSKQSNLTTQLQQAASGAATIPTSELHASNTETAAPAPVPTRKDSLAVPSSASHSGANPISFGKPRRESNTGSFMGGMSWSGMSVGSLLNDDIMMGGLSPSMNSPNFHSSSYLPRMEANYWNNLKCCEIVFSDLHELVHHLEEAHHRGPGMNPFAHERLPRKKSSSTNPAENGGRGSQMQSVWSSNGLQNGRFGPGSQDTGRKQSTITMQDMDTIGEMEMDDSPTVSGQGYGGYQQMDGYSTDSTPQMSQASPNGQFGHSSSSSPQGEHQMHTNYSNAMFSNMSQQMNNTQTQPPQPSQQLNFNQPLAFGQPNGVPQLNGGYGTQQNNSTLPFNTEMFNQLSSSFGKMEFGQHNDMRDLCINEPAKNLYSDDGTFNSQQYPQFNFNNGIMNGVSTSGAGEITSNNDENAKKLQAQRLANGVGKQPTEEERPFKCPVIGCEKAYKNANGLRYHEKHGHASQKLKDNGNGTFSIVDPATSMPYPGTVGMEKEKPYRCEVCGKRYKNLNGLKYHRNHSPPCNPDFTTNQMPNLTDGEAVY